MQDKIATNSNLISFSREGKRTMLQLLPLYKENGYDHIDLNFCEMMNPRSELRDNGEPYIEELLTLKERLSIVYIQAHAPYPQNWKAMSKEERKTSNTLIKKSIDYAYRLSIPHIVLHPIPGTAEENIEYFKPFMEHSDGRMKIAIENMENKEEIWSADELLEIAESLGEYAGICLDTGHANITGENIPRFIEKTKGRLLGLHIADNDGKSDQHMLPGWGNIKWEEVIPALKKHYNGYLNYECMFFSKNLPSSLSEDLIKLSLSVGKWLMGL